MIRICLGLLILATAPAMAEVTRFETLSVQRPALEGRHFGERGTAEIVTGRATIAVDPADPRNAIIADLALAPRNVEGRVEAVADVVLLRPERPNGILLVDIPNRGRKVVTALVEDAPESSGRLERAEDAGRSLLLARGYTLAWIGWQGDVAPGSLGIKLPVLAGITGPSREEWVFGDAADPVEAGLSWPAADLDPAKARLTVRARAEDERLSPPDMRFRFLDSRRIAITRPAAGFDGSALYEFTYTARDPTVAGLGFAAIRDVALFLRSETGSGNPLATGGRTGIDHVIGFGVSQSGRVLRDFLHLGFNADAAGRPVFDALMPVIAGSRRSFTNARFAQAGRAPSPHRDRLYPVDQFPFTYAVTDDAVSGRRDGLFLRCRETGTCPRVMQVESEYELWGSIGGLLTTDTTGRHLDLPPEVRAYMVTGAPHYASRDARTRTDPHCALPLSPVRIAAPVRALLVALEAWLREGVEPPASRYPTRGDGTLAEPEGLYPPIPGLPFAGLANRAQWIEPGAPLPSVRGSYPLLLPRPDPDGNALAGIRLPLIAAPRATYTAWNPTRGLASATLCEQQGGVLAFPATEAERRASGDPRRSLEARYPTPGDYVAAVREAAERLVAERLLLPEDAAEMVAEAAQGRLAR